LKDIICLCDYKGRFGSKDNAQPYRSGMDKKLLQHFFAEREYQTHFIKITNMELNHNYQDQYILYTSQEDAHYKYKSFIEDIIYYLYLYGAKVIPHYKYLKANNNKVFMELLRNIVLSLEYQIDTKVFGCLEEALSTNWEYPLVVKTAQGACGSGVYLAKDRNELLNCLKIVADTKEIKYDLHEFIRALRYKGYIKDSSYREKFIIQKFIPNLINDWKVYVFWDKIFVFYRPVLKKRVFKASGGGYDNYYYAENAKIPEGLFDYAIKAREQLDVPNASLDIAYDGERYYLLEYQCLYFGTAGIVRSNYYFKRENDNWIAVSNNETVESAYVHSITSYIQYNNT